MSASALHRVDVDGTSLLRRPGEGRGGTLVLLHGIGSDAETWAPVMRAVDPGVTVLGWDAPGYGASRPVGTAEPDPTAYAERLAAALDGLGIEEVVLVGHSLGALFAARFAVLYPTRVDALALLSPASGYRVPSGAALPSAVQARIDDLATLGPAEFAARRAARLLFRPERKPDVLAGVRRAMGAVNLAGYAQAVRALGAGDLLGDAALVEARTLVVVGAGDAVTPPAGARAVHAVLRRPAGLHEVPEAGHALPQEEPALVARLLSTLASEDRHGG